jgi:hypothetical protein
LPGAPAQRANHTALGRRLCAFLVLLTSCTSEFPHWDDAGWRLTSAPADGAQRVDRQGRIVVQLDRLPLPRSVTRSSVALHSGAVSASLDLRVQPVTREIWITQRAPLEVGVIYELVVQGLVDLDGVEQPKPYRARFETGTQLGSLEPQAAPAPDEVLALLADRCASNACHGGEEPARGLDLASAAGIETTAKNAASQSHTTSTVAGRGTLNLPSPLIIDASAKRGDPATSYLVYKLLGEPHILGDPMPPPGEAPLTDPEIQQVCDWIYAGAPTQ